MASTRVIIQSTATHIIKYMGCTETNLPLGEIEYLYAFTEKERQDVQNVYDEYAEKRRAQREEIEEARVLSNASTTPGAIRAQQLRDSRAHRANEVKND